MAPRCKYNNYIQLVTQWQKILFQSIKLFKEHPQHCYTAGVFLNTTGAFIG